MMTMPAMSHAVVLAWLGLGPGSGSGLGLAFGLDAVVLAWLGLGPGSGSGLGLAFGLDAVVWGLVIHIAVRGGEQLMEHDEDHHAAHLVRGW